MVASSIGKTAFDVLVFCFVLLPSFSSVVSFREWHLNHFCPLIKDICNVISPRSYLSFNPEQFKMTNFYFPLNLHVSVFLVQHWVWVLPGDLAFPLSHHEAFYVLCHLVDIVSSCGIAYAWETCLPENFAPNTHNWFCSEISPRRFLDWRNP